MKIAFLLFFFLLLSLTVKAQDFTDVQKQLLSGDNLLKNSGFESGVTSWTSGAGSLSTLSSGQVKGKKALRLTLSSQIASFYQDSTSYATAFADGINGTTYIRAKTTLSNIYLCRRQAGVLIASTDGAKITDCVLVPNSGKWSELSLPVIFGATSNGLAIVSLTPSTAVAVAVTGTIDLDDGRLEAGSKASSQTVCRDVSCEVEFSVNVSSTGIATEETGGDWVNGNCSNATTPICTINSSIFTVAPHCWSIPGAAGFTGYENVVSTSQVSIYTISNSAVAVAGARKYICRKQGADYVNAKALEKGSVYSATNNNSNDISQVIFTSQTVEPDNFISAMNKSIGQTGSGATYTGGDYYNLYAVLWAQAGTTTTAGDVYRISSAKGASASADWAASKTITIDYLTNSPFIRAAGTGMTLGGYTDSDNKAHTHNVPHGTATGAGTYVTGGNSTLNGTNGTATSTGGTESKPKNVSLNAFIRFRSNSLITGSFAEVVTSIGTTSPDIQSVIFGTGANCASVCSTGTCSLCSQTGNKITSVTWNATGSYNINGLDGTKYVCTGGGEGTSYVNAYTRRDLSTTSLVRLQAGLSTTLTNAAISVICMGVK